MPQPDRECVSLDDYRDRFASYRMDPDLKKLHQSLAGQFVWDDHEGAFLLPYTVWKLNCMAAYLALFIMLATVTVADNVSENFTFRLQTGF